ncbi:Beta-hexosaminidase, partial [Thalictrum thalictroides]
MIKSGPYLADCWNSTVHVKKWLQDRNMTAKDAYQYFVLKAQEMAIAKGWTPVNWLQDRNMTAKDAYQYFVLKAQEMAIAKGWTPVNWEETFNSFKENLNPRTVVHNWLGGGVCPQAVAKGFRCIFSNQGVWYLDHLDVPWEGFYNSDPLEGISNVSEQNLVLGGEVCMWGETADSSDVLQTIWPRAAAASVGIKALGLFRPPVMLTPAPVAGSPTK